MYASSSSGAWVVDAAWAPPAERAAAGAVMPLFDARPCDIPRQQLVLASASSGSLSASSNVSSGTPGLSRSGTWSSGWALTSVGGAAGALRDAWDALLGNEPAAARGGGEDGCEDDDEDTALPTSTSSSDGDDAGSDFSDSGTPRWAYAPPGSLAVPAATRGAAARAPPAAASLVGGLVGGVAALPQAGRRALKGLQTFVAKAAEELADGDVRLPSTSQQALALAEARQRHEALIDPIHGYMY